jgi:hypothetical protein
METNALDVNAQDTLALEGDDPVMRRLNEDPRESYQSITGEASSGPIESTPSKNSPPKCDRTAS